MTAPQQSVPSSPLVSQPHFLTDGNGFLLYSGVRTNAPVPAGAGAASVVIKPGPGYLSGCVVTAAGSTAALYFYDNPTTGSGQLIGAVPSGAGLGTYWPFSMPALNGITALQASVSPAVTVAFD